MKWQHVKDRRPQLRRRADLWREVEKGVFSATLVVIDPEPVQKIVRSALISDGAEEGHDFDERDLVRGCSVALVKGTPIAYLPSELMKIVGQSGYDLVGGFDDFTPEAIRLQIGDGLNDAPLFAARAHAMFDAMAMAREHASTTLVFRSPLAKVVLAELLATRRVFDNEHVRSLAVLNRASERIAAALATRLSSDDDRFWSPLVSEADSKSYFELQAADVAAGWAREMLETNEPRALANKFERVWLNGELLRKLML